MTHDNDTLQSENLSDQARNVTEWMTDLSSRREFMKKGAAASTAVGLGLSASAGSAAAHEKEGELSTLEVLNFALTLEMLEATFYEQGLERFSESDFQNSNFAQELGDGLTDSTYEYFQEIRDHEQTHVDAITSVINELGGDPVSGLEFEFGFETVDEFVATAMTLENTGVFAYNGVIGEIDEPEYTTTAAQIATVEGRHASYLNLLNGEIPFPRAFDKALPMEEVLQAVNPFIVSDVTQSG